MVSSSDRPLKNHNNDFYDNFQFECRVLWADNYFWDPIMRIILY